MPAVDDVAVGVVKAVIGIAELTAALVALVKVELPTVAVTAKEYE